MNKRHIALLLTILTIGCQPKKQEEEKAAVDSVVVETPKASTAAQLTEEQKAEGWILLFDGESLKGWEFFKEQTNNSWDVADGALHCKPFVDGIDSLRGDIMTQDSFENFEFSFDWKMSAQGNSGVMYRVTKEFDQPYKSGPEYQVLDDGGYPGETLATNMSACVYAMYEASNKKLNTVGEWNSSKIIAKGNVIEHWLNGEKVITYEIGSADWKKRKANSKWKDEAGYGIAKAGHFDFQDHGHEVWYKNIMVKPL